MGEDMEKDRNLIANNSPRPKNIYPWTSQGRRRRERQQESWKDQVMDFIKSRNLEEAMAKDRHV